MSRLVDLGGGRFAHASGGLWLPDLRTVVLADVHLGYGWALRRRGQLGPVSDEAVRRKLNEAIAELQPEQIVFLGDVVHAPRPAPEEKRSIEQTLRSLAAGARVTIVLGNHDRGLVRDFPDLPVEICREWMAPGLVAVHGDQTLPEGAHVIAGHVHPAYAVEDHAGASHKLPVFLAAKSITLLPAFSPLAAGVDIRSWRFGVELKEGKVVAVSGKRAVDLGPLPRLLARSIRR